MKSILRQVTRISAMLLLLSLCLSAFFGCEGAGNSEDTTAPAEKRLVVDETYRVVISAEADDLTRKAADLVVSSLKEKAGLELSVVTDAEAPVAHEIVLGATNRAYSTAVLYTYNVFFGDEALHVSASDSNRLYFAVEAVLDAWTASEENKPCKGNKNYRGWDENGRRIVHNAQKRR